jgi:hypothetical protein
MEEGANNLVTQQMLTDLRVTKRWTRFLSVLGFIVTGLILVVVIVQSIIIAFMGGKGLMIGNTLLIMICVPILLFFIYFLPSFFLTKYASSINALLKVDGGAAALETAVRRERIFWRYLGILAVVCLVIYALVLVGVMSGALLNYLSVGK